MSGTRDTTCDDIPAAAEASQASDIPEDTEQQETGTVHGTAAGSFEQLKVTMLEKGWCPHQIESLAQVYSLPALHIFAGIDRAAQRPEYHGPCRQQQHCIAYNAAPPELYQTKHAADCPGSSCYTIKVPYEDLVRVIRAGDVPLVSIYERPGEGISLRIYRRQFRSDYATISHVWADGLGNPKENALPLCQVRQLRSLLDHNTIYKPRTWIKQWDDVIFGWRQSKMFWMDTLCVPPQDSELRAECIDAMSSIYAGSSRVFVLDKELRATRVDSAVDGLNGLCKIACSVWMCRSWTLQEALLPEQCLFQFKGDVLQPTAMQDSYDYSYTAVDEIKKKIVGFLSDDRDSSSGVGSFVSTWNNLAGRSTTQPEDLYIVLASCLNFTLRQFRAFPTHEEKIQRIILSHQELPMSLFFNTGPRLRPTSNHYNRWVPTQVSQHLLDCDDSIFTLPNPNVSTSSHHGTLIKLSPGRDISILLINEVISTPSSYIIQTTDQSYLIEPFRQGYDSFQTAGGVGTCLIIPRRSSGASTSRSGACFYVCPSRVSGSGIISSHEQSVFDLVYFSPVSTKILDSPRGQILGNLQRFVAHDIERTREFWVRFGMPSLPPFRNQEMRSGALAK